MLLENNGVLPLHPQKIALYGPGSRMTVKGGSGSGDVRERYSVTIEEGLRNAGFAFPTTLWMDRFQGKYEADIAAWRQGLEKQVQKYSPVPVSYTHLRRFCLVSVGLSGGSLHGLDL